MTEKPSADGADESTADPDSLSIASTYKVLGRLDADDGAGMLGRNDADSGTPIGVQGAVPNNPTGFGLATPDAARIEGDIEASSGHALTVGGTPALRLDPTGTDGDGVTGGGNVIGGWSRNFVDPDVVGATIGGGGRDTTLDFNSVTDNYGTVGGGVGNTAGDARSGATNATYATVGGGEQNTAGGTHATVGGGENNRTGKSGASMGKLATVSGGQNNVARAEGSTVGGGGSNMAASGADYATVSGGQSNVAKGTWATIGGGDDNTASSRWATVGGGVKNTASGFLSTVDGGDLNTASGEESTVGGGRNNTASGEQSTVGGGVNNRTGKSGTFKGKYATVPGGRDNVAQEDYSFAAGRKAKATNGGAFVWGDSTTTSISSTGPNQFLVQASNGAGFGTDDPICQLHVVQNVTGTGPNLTKHAAGIQNTATGTADVLGLQLPNIDQPDSTNNFITFLDDDAVVGSVQGDGGGGVTFDSATADYAEYLPRLDPDESIEPAEVVGVVEGAITKRTADADRALVVSDRPIVSGNSPGTTADDRQDHETVAFVGQVPVRVRGPVEAGDLIVPSGEGDGTGRAVAPREWRPDDGPIVGQAWEASEDEGVGEVLVAVGIDDPATVAPDRERIDALEAALDEKDERIDRLESDRDAQRERIDRLERETDRKDDRIDDLEADKEALRHRVADLKAENETLRDRLAAVEAHLGIDDTPPTPADD